MRKRKKGKTLRRTKSQQKALVYSLIKEIIERGRIKTSQARAKEVRPALEKVITRAAKNDLASRRRLLRFLPKSAVKKLIDETGPKYKERPGGYSRIIKLEPRKSDGAKMAIIELV